MVDYVQILNEYGIIIGLVIILVAVVIFRRYSKNKNLKKQFLAERQQHAMQQPMAQPKTSPPQYQQQDQETPQNIASHDPLMKRITELEERNIEVMETQKKKIDDLEKQLEERDFKKQQQEFETATEDQDLFQRELNQVGENMEDFYKEFGEVGMDKNKDIVEDVKRLTVKMSEQDSQIDKDMTTDLQETNDKLKEILSAKEKIRTYGKELARLFKKYESREIQLRLTIRAMKQLKKQIETDPGAIDKLYLELKEGEKRGDNTETDERKNHEGKTGERQERYRERHKERH